MSLSDQVGCYEYVEWWSSKRMLECIGRIHSPEGLATLRVLRNAGSIPRSQPRWASGTKPLFERTMILDHFSSINMNSTCSMMERHNERVMSLPGLTSNRYLLISQWLQRLECLSCMVFANVREMWVFVSHILQYTITLLSFSRNPPSSLKWILGNCTIIAMTFSVSSSYSKLRSIIEQHQAMLSRPQQPSFKHEAHFPNRFQSQAWRRSNSHSSPVRPCSRIQRSKDVLQLLWICHWRCLSYCWSSR